MPAFPASPVSRTRTPRRLRLAGAASLVLVTLLTATAAHAAAPPLSTSLTGDAKAAYESGKLLLGDHDYAGAATKFRAAYDAAHDARLLWNIAVCEKEMRHYARASALVDRFLGEGGATIEPEQLAQARATQATLKQFFSTVPLSVQPEGATVAVDGQEIGKSPFSAPTTLDIGNHTLHVAKEGFTPVDRRVDVTGSNAAALTVTLVPAPAVTLAFLAVRPSDPVDTIAVDNRVVGTGAWDGTLPPGSHQVKVTAAGKQPHIAEITLAAGEHRSLDVTLENEEKKTALWPWLVGGGAVVVAGAVVGGYFLFKPGDTQAAFPSTQLQNISLRSARTGGQR